MVKIFALLLVGLSVGLGNFAVSVAVGLSGVTKASRIRLVLVFGFFETLMPLIGLILGQSAAGALGSSANITGGILLIATGLFVVINALNTEPDNRTAFHKSFKKLLLTGLALSVDNLIIGFSLGASNEPLLLSALVIGATSVAFSLLGLEMGRRLKVRVEEYSELLSGVLLILVGIAIAIKIL
jgi:manganese efflux pump family protein